LSEDTERFVTEGFTLTPELGGWVKATRAACKCGRDVTVLEVISPIDSQPLSGLSKMREVKNEMREDKKSFVTIDEDERKRISEQERIVDLWQADAKKRDEKSLAVFEAIMDGLEYLWGNSHISLWAMNQVKKVIEPQYEALKEWVEDESGEVWRPAASDWLDDLED